MTNIRDFSSDEESALLAEGAAFMLLLLLLDDDDDDEPTGCAESCGGARDDDDEDGTGVSSEVSIISTESNVPEVIARFVRVSKPRMHWNDEGWTI